MNLARNPASPASTPTAAAGAAAAKNGSRRPRDRCPTTVALLVAVLILGSGPAAAVAPGNPAPDFTLATLDGRPVSLADLKGKWVALEWTNPDCPFVQKHYGAGNMQATQRAAAEARVLWLQINSTRTGHPDHKSARQMSDWLQAMKASPTYAALDEAGTVGRAYSARTTPHMYLINPAGQIVYNGAIDDRRSTDPADIAGARNHMRAAIAEAVGGKPVSLPATTPYGCSIKY
ncbi:MAG TPA: redoxin domain-containing protein [Accumulibacter sp.]|uniref:redoxin domain-containing protein n=1 Tax=Accumulibacter sp. TaxID=2053492 RepID=UPI002B5EB3D2|nr:redoxin domain-containing protein [Accumulibacter sp.]HRD90756.1 redoxin domain-containing protein [Accumulibacter sp.]